MTHLLTDDYAFKWPICWQTTWLLCFQMTHLLTDNLTTMLSNDPSVDRWLCFQMTHLLTDNLTAMLSNDTSVDRELNYAFRWLICWQTSMLLNDPSVDIQLDYAFRWLICWQTSMLSNGLSVDIWLDWASNPSAVCLVTGQPTQWQNMTLAGSEGVAQGRVNQNSVSVLVDHFWTKQCHQRLRSEIVNDCVDGFMHRRHLRVHPAVLLKLQVVLWSRKTFPQGRTQFSSFRLSLRWYLCARKSPSLRSFPNVAFETVAFEGPRLKALVYDILPPATAIIGYAMLQPLSYLVMPCSSHCHTWLCGACPRLPYLVMLSASHRHTWLCHAPATAILGYTIGLIAAQMAVSFVTDNSNCIRCFLHISVYIVYTIANKTKVIWIEIKHLMSTCMLWHYVVSTV